MKIARLLLFVPLFVGLAQPASSQDPDVFHGGGSRPQRVATRDLVPASSFGHPDAMRSFQDGLPGQSGPSEPTSGGTGVTPKPAAPEDKPKTPDPSPLGLTARVNNGGLLFETASKDHKFHVGALIQQDYAFFNQDLALKALPGGGQGPAGGVGELQDSVFFRRARIRFDGMAYDFFEWDFDCELLANNSVVFDDLWIGATNVPVMGNVRVGHVKIPMGIESITSNRVFTFVERASMFDAFLPEYGPGLLAFDSYQDAKFVWAACLHRLDPSNNGTDSGDGQWNGTFRASSLLYNSTDDSHYLHVGSAYSIRDDRDGAVRFRGRPEWRDTTTVGGLNNRFVDTGDIAASDYDLFQAEMAWVAGPLSFQVEGVQSVVRTTAGGRESFNGGYALVSYFLTGESRPYDKRIGRFARLKPTENFSFRKNGEGPYCRSAFGCGAWELAGRYSWTDLTSANILGGTEEAFTLGVNWYWNYNFRIQANYVHTNRNASNPASISGDVDAFVLRFSLDL